MYPACHGHGGFAFQHTNVIRFPIELTRQPARFNPWLFYWRLMFWWLP